MLQRVLASDCHNGDDVPCADPLEALLHWGLLEEPVSENIETHHYSSVMPPFEIIISLRYDGGTPRTNPLLRKTNDSRLLHLHAPAESHGERLCEEAGRFRASFKENFSLSRKRLNHSRMDYGLRVTSR